MNILSKIILGLISLCLLTFLLYVTYLTSNNYTSIIPNNNELSQGLFVLKSNDKNELKTFSTNVFNSGSTYIKKFDISNEIIFSKGDLSINSNNGLSIITLEEGIYYFNLKNIDSNYIIKGKGFEINNKGPGTFIVNNINPNKNLVFSISSVIELNLKNLKTNERATSLDIYPHSYIIFSSSKNGFIKNADLLRVSQVNTIGFYNKQINNNQKIENEFLNIISLNDKNNISIVEKFIQYTKNQYIENLDAYNNFIKYSFINLPGEELIMKYSNFFINPGKKSSYYKNIIIRNLNKLLVSDKIDTETVNNIFNSIRELEKIDNKGLDEIKKIATYYYYISLKSNANEYTKINLYSIVNNLDKKIFKVDYKSLIALEKIFFDYDYIGNKLFYSEISSFRKNYFNDLDINIKGENINKYNLEELEKVDYLLFFLENILLSADYSSENVETKDLIIIFDDYVKISSSFYVFNDEKVKRTGLFTNSKILIRFIEIFETKFFYKNRNENGLLELKEEEKINMTDLILLENNIAEIIKFFNEQKTVLSPDKNTKDKIIIEQYISTEEKYKEYFSALKNYKEYIVKYDKNKTNLLNTNSIVENKEIFELSSENATNYLNTFNGIRLEYSSIKIMDYNYCNFPSVENENINVEIPYCYKIENINIDGKNVSFLLHPMEKNKIDEIYVENQKKPGSYKLDEIKISMDELLKVTTTDKDKYDFSNFLINTFGQKNLNTNNNNSTNNINTNNSLEEDPVIKIFKRNKLLGKNGDFSVVSDFLEINYNDLIVKKQTNGEYGITINNAKFNLELGRNITYLGTFSSTYDFSNKHSFVNPVLYLVDKRSENPLLNGNKINIKGEYPVKTISEDIKIVFNDYDIINQIIQSINYNLDVSVVKINYLKSLNQIDFEFNYNGNLANIKISAGNIVKFMYNNKSYLNTSTSYRDIDKILNSIKN